MKRDSVEQVIKKFTKEDRVSLRKAGIKIGRYHIFLTRMLKPNAVDLRVKLWKLYFQNDKKYTVPKSGLNFLKNESYKNKQFLLLYVILFILLQSKLHFLDRDLLKKMY